MAANPGLDQVQANAAAWQQGKRLLDRAIDERLDFAIETTLGGNTMSRMLAAASLGIEIVSGTSDGQRSSAYRPCATTNAFGPPRHPEADIRRRWRHSLLNLVQLLPVLTALRVYDNSVAADPAAGQAPQPTLVLHVEGGQILGPPDLSSTPDWAKPIVATALELDAR